eukprot:393303_1
MKYINTSFYTAHTKNKTLQLKQRQSIIDTYEFDPIVKCIQHAGSRTWVIHPTRTYLNNEEIANGYEGPLNLLNIQNSVESGDKLLFHNGHYIETTASEFEILEE